MLPPQAIRPSIATSDRADKARKPRSEEQIDIEISGKISAARKWGAATPIGAESFEVNGQVLPVRPNMGLLTQPFSCIGLPVCAVPVWGTHASQPNQPDLPVGVQVIAAPWREDLVLRVAAALEAAGVAHAPVAALSSEETPA